MSLKVSTERQNVTVTLVTSLHLFINEYESFLQYLLSTAALYFVTSFTFVSFLTFFSVFVHEMLTT